MQNGKRGEWGGAIAVLVLRLPEANVRQTALQQGAATGIEGPENPDPDRLADHWTTAAGQRGG